MTGRASDLEPRRGQVIEVRAGRDGLWRWTFRDLDHGTVLPSNRGYGSRPEAEEVAKVAYPGVPLAVPGGRGGPALGLAVMGATVAGLAGLAAGAAGAAVAVAAVLARRGVRRLLPGGRR